MSNISTETIYNIATKLIGDIEPIGESNYDEKCAINIKEYQHLINMLISDIASCLPYKTCYQASMKNIGISAERIINDLNEDIEEWLSYER